MNDRSSKAESSDSFGEKVGKTIRNEGRQVAGEVKDSAKRVARGQRDSAGDYIAALAHAAQLGAEDLEAAGYLRTASTVAHTAEETDSLARHLQASEPAEIWGEVEDFARRHPALVFGAGFAVAFGVTRFLKSSTESAETESVGTENAAPPQAERTDTASSF